MTQKQYERLKAKLDNLDAMYGDLPDGAYFAVLEENGVDTGDMAAMAEYETTNNVPEEERRFA